MCCQDISRKTRTIFPVFFLFLQASSSRILPVWAYLLYCIVWFVKISMLNRRDERFCISPSSLPPSMLGEREKRSLSTLVPDCSLCLRTDCAGSQPECIY